MTPDRKRRTLHAEVREQVEEGSAVDTDPVGSYSGLDAGCEHGVDDQAE